MGRAGTIGGVRAAVLTLPTVRQDHVVMKGGWDQITPVNELTPGYLRDVQNFECAPTGIGYTRIAGYERTDGRPKPSAATYLMVQVSGFTTVPMIGQTVTQAVSGATGVIIALVNASETYLIVTKVTGTFNPTSALTTPGPITVGTAIASSSTISARLHAQYTNAAADQYRADIGAVPGSGPVRGVMTMTFSSVDYLYALRDNAGGTATVLYRASSTGWTAIPFYYEVRFTAGGATAPADGATLTQGAVTATIKRVVQQSGSWSGSTAAGRAIVTNPSGGNFVAGAATIGAVTVTLSAAQTAITLAPGGKVEWVVWNFAGQAGSQRLYGVDGVNRGFEFDGDVWVPITTGTSPDTPKHLTVHKNHLFYAFLGSVIHAGPGTPYQWGAADGASEIAVSDTITGFLRQPGVQDSATLAIFTLSSASILYGTAATGSAPWNLVPFTMGVSAQHYSAQNLTNSHALDFSGVIDLQTALTYGNFKTATLTFPIHTFITDKRSRVANSSIYRDKSQYRLFFVDGTGLYMTIVNGQFKGSTKTFFPHVVFATAEGSLSTGEEVAYFGATNGFVYQMEKGSSFDGDAISASLMFTWNAMGNPRLLKTYLQGAIELHSNHYSEIGFSYRVGDGSTSSNPSAVVLYEVALSDAGAWDDGGFWDDGRIWDGRTVAQTTVDLTGTAENIAMMISSGTDYIHPFTVNSMIVDWIARRRHRG